MLQAQRRNAKLRRYQRGQQAHDQEPHGPGQAVSEYTDERRRIRYLDRTHRATGYAQRHASGNRVHSANAPTGLVSIGQAYPRRFHYEAAALKGWIERAQIGAVTE